jgi:dsDNA-specific endonuclease/ATPase MutS2
MAPRRRRRDDDRPAPRRGLRRSIRHDAVDTTDDDERDAPDARREPGRPPEILLRKLKLAEALERLEFQLRAHAARGPGEVLVVHGKGQHSAGGVPVLGPEVRRWCDAHPSLVASWSEAPLRWGGAGAIVVRLRAQ